jgi:anaerobic C4-dicarboxylate transporter
VRGPPIPTAAASFDETGTTKIVTTLRDHRLVRPGLLLGAAVAVPGVIAADVPFGS